MRLLILGATGPLGLCVVAEAVRRGHHVRALVRHAGRLPVSPLHEEQVGDATDAEEFAKACVGIDAVVSALGPGNKRRTSTVMADSMRAFLPAAERAGVRRFVGISALGVGSTWQDLPWLLRPAYRLLLAQPLRDKEAAERLLVASDLEWTLVYPPILTTGQARGRYRAAPRLALKGAPAVDRADVALLMLDCVEGGLHLRERVEITAA
ncbi:MAG: NAD(P)-dependent oxidoreductase [Thermoplasmatota archaeon]